MKKTPIESWPSISFIIPTLNAASILPRCLTAIREQDYPQDRVEIIVADAYSSDTTREIAAAYKAKVIDNPEVLHEPGKTLASKEAQGELLFYTDADNILATHSWLRLMAAPYREEKGIVGLLPQTTAPPDSSSLNQYLGYLFTDPLTWFVYGRAANPIDYQSMYQPKSKTQNYEIYEFTPADHPLFGLSQGVGVARSFQRGGQGHADDILSGIQLIEAGGRIAYVPTAFIYHYHVEGLASFWRKYRWRIRNNLQQSVKGMGLTSRLHYFSKIRKLRLLLFVPYSLTLIGPAIDSIRLTIKWKSLTMLWHIPACLCLSLLIISEYTKHYLGLAPKLGQYGK